MPTAYEAVIGLEVHAELETRSKMFCGCAVVDSTTAPPNTVVCPVCLGMPGVLPVINRRAVEFAIRVGLALNCQIATVNVFARKSYFYPDLPKGYQISQYELPLAVDGWLEIDLPDGSTQTHPHPPRAPGRRHRQARPRRETAAWSISTARACRCWKSSPSRTSTAPKRPKPMPASCAPSCNIWA